MKFLVSQLLLINIVFVQINFAMHNGVVVPPLKLNRLVNPALARVQSERLMRCEDNREEMRQLLEKKQSAEQLKKVHEEQIKTSHEEIVKTFNENLETPEKLEKVLQESQKMQEKSGQISNGFQQRGRFRRNTISN